jgi:hypothetical protein
MDQARRIRIWVTGLLLMFLALIGSLMAIPWLIGEPLQVVRPGAPAVLADTRDGDLVDARIQVGGSGDFLLVVAGGRKVGAADQPTIRFGMPVRQGSRIAAEVERVDAGFFQATGRLDMPGRWLVEISFGGMETELEFTLAEF